MVALLVLTWVGFWMKFGDALLSAAGSHHFILPLVDDIVRELARLPPGMNRSLVLAGASAATIICTVRLLISLPSWIRKSIDSLRSPNNPG